MNGQQFAEVLGQCRDGTFHEDGADELAELVAAVVQNGKPGTLQIALKVHPGPEGTVFMSVKINGKRPKAQTASTIFYITDDGSLSRRDPRQPELPFREVPRPNDDKPGEEAAAEGAN